jgi:uncharacterized protein (DUF433 family)
VVTLLKFDGMLYGQISIDPEIMSGAAVFSGTRVPIQTLFDYLESGDALEMFLADFPSVTKTAAISVLEMAKISLTSEKVLHENFT